MSNAKDKAVTALDVFGKEHQVATRDLSWRPAVYAIVIENNKVLMLRQFKTKHQLPGGGVDLGEDLEEAVVREAKEETGLDVEIIRPTGVKTSLFYDGHSKGDDKAFHSILIYYLCKQVGGELSTEGFDEDEVEYAELAEWVPLEKLDDIELSSTVDYRDVIRSCF
jgi:8-oxo-dGTP diphosphatase